ncbi:3-isopropylmalate dehydratase (large subunit) [Frankia sp. AiPs1]|uniref:3-isopropylmalate dehydratase large subunit n=1 Tax=Frankia sp. AiPa1 TaxID=573492 RepID=UPI00202ACD2F|nr:3-isopropylmalate dehydratase large subunit [Frankia sp. AiPa1]MCL9758112.1 3-isopropylmalate dehydratase large subunit [Frankia sp. AiPa1]
MTSAARTLLERVWDAHIVEHAATGDDLLYIDLHLVHEASSPQAFDGLTASGRRLRRPDLTLGVEDHNVPTASLRLADPLSRLQVEALRRNCAVHKVELFRLGDPRQGIVHVVAPEQGYVRPGMTIVCGDSHTSTLGAFGALAFGVGSSDVEHILATQTLPLARPEAMAVEFTGRLPEGATAKDMILALLAEVGANGAHGHVIEYRGSPIGALSMEERMTLCNMSVEVGARAGLIAPDETTFDYLASRPHVPGDVQWDTALEYWRTLRSDDEAVFNRTVTLDVSRLTPHVTWGTNPGQAVPLSGAVPDPELISDSVERASARRALAYMGLRPGTLMTDIDIDVIFIGSCTNGRLADLRAAAQVLRGRRVADGVRMLVVPGSGQIRRAAEEEGLDRVFQEAGAQWRLPGCSMCMGMNEDRLEGAERCASTSNRNYEGRQGPRARTHLVSPAVAAATAVLGRLASPADLS